MSGSIVGFIRNSEITSNYPRISFASCKRNKEAASQTSAGLQHYSQHLRPLNLAGIPHMIDLMVSFED